MFVLGTCTQSTHATYICIYTFRYICTRPLTWINTDRQTQHWHRHRWQKGITLIMPSLPVQNEDSLVENMYVCVYCVGPSISSSQTIMLPSSYLWTPVCPVKDTWVYGPSRAQPLSVASTDCPTQARTHIHTHTQLGGTLLVCNCRSLLWSHWETHTEVPKPCHLLTGSYVWNFDSTSTLIYMPTLAPGAAPLTYRPPWLTSGPSPVAGTQAPIDKQT